MPDIQNRPGDFRLGIDIGTTYSAAAIVSGDRAEICTLGMIAAQIPTVVLHRADGEVLVGESADRRAAAEPTRVAREFKRRLGDPIPIIVGATPYGAEALMAEVIAAIVQQVTEREGRQPEMTVLTHPANYTDYKRDLLLEAARLAGLDLRAVQLITEPEAAAISYAQQRHIGPGEVIAVYDFGGGTFDAAIVRDTPTGFQLLGTPEGMDRLGGIDFDQAVLAHVDAVLGGLISGADSSDPLVRAGQARLREECRTAKETLSTDTEATIAVSIPGVHTEVRLTRDELEEMVRPRVIETVKALGRTITSAGLTPEAIDRVLLVGGSSRMPIVAQVLRETLGRPVSVDANPKFAIALGAAHAAGAQVAKIAAPVAPLTDPPDQPVTDHHTPRRDPPTGGGRRHRTSALAVAVMWVVVGLIALVGTAAAVYLTVGRHDSGPGGSAGATSPIIAPPETSPLATVTSDAPVGNDTTPGTTPGTTPATTPGTTTMPVAQGNAQPYAFNGGHDGSGIPGPARSAATPAPLTGLAIAPDGDVYVVTAGPPILRISNEQVAVASNLTSATSATSITIGSDGTLFVATPAGIVRIVDGVEDLILDGPAAGLSATIGALALDGAGNLYIADNGTARIIRRAPDGALTLVAGTGTQAASGSTPAEGAAATTSPIGRVSGLVVARDGTLFMADQGLRRVRTVATDGTITTAAGGGNVGLDAFTEAAPASTTAAYDLDLTAVDGLAIDSQQNVYIADGSNKLVIRIAHTGQISVIQVGSAPTAGLAIDAAGTLIYSDEGMLWGIAHVTGTS